MIIGENNILQTVYEKHFHRRQDARSYLNEQLRLKVDSPYGSKAQDFIIAFINEPTPVINTVAEQIEYGKRISKEVLPKVLRIYLNNYIHRANDFNINNALMFRGENWRNKLSYADYMTELRKKVEALPDHVTDRESIELIVKYVFFSVLHNICTSESESTLPDKIITTDTVDEALDKYYRANLLENIYTWTGDMNLSYKYI